MTLSDRDFTGLLEVAQENVLAIVACDEGLPDGHYQALAQVGKQTVAGALLQNYSVPESALRTLLQLHPEYEHMIRCHPNSPPEWKLDLPNENITTEALHRFFRQVNATQSERGKLLRRWSKDGQRRFGDCWEEVHATAAV